MTSRSDAAPRAAFWAPADPDAPTPAVRAAAAHALGEHAIALEDEPVLEPAVPSLRKRLAAAVADYEALHLDDAAQAFATLATDIASEGGGDLDRRALCDAFLDAGLTLLELGRTERAWEAFVAAARIDPTRTIDPAHVTPRGATAFHRAVTELTTAARVELAIEIPPGSTLRLDGEPQTASKVAVLPGVHYAGVSAPGFETWRGVVTATPPAVVLRPTPRPIQPPAIEDPQLVASVALHRRGTDGAWSLRVRARQPSGRHVELEEALGPSPGPQTSALVLAALGAESGAHVALVAPAPPPKKTPLVKRWWFWTAIGAGATGLAVGLGVGLRHDHDSRGGTAGGSIGAL